MAPDDQGNLRQSAPADFIFICHPGNAVLGDKRIIATWRSARLERRMSNCEPFGKKASQLNLEVLESI
ncbi:MAG: hypothetical protein CL807_09860 [Citromicrobium sp.]|jgi:hypothetical protein|uniref:Uncharacterized protein n=1 Tax=Tsuneonella suprasediminis TaxID=2306996 RepID=A0A419R117_9SPHN|nr:hypothetical protein [Citromicrobium sp.]MAO94992.1 hypothetical protein [Citromicrobium sp.]MBD77165.1 hypothetical protein [Citromicrobium sp.]MBT46509.1 hypothetical protein [Citromicrobium sp.]RJX67602.1 hypothetical protein D6858_06220 [Tsuneonella suprasediminis]|tara:strand:- start:95 stop:298 length:204 start_codon:yes stop_codon:yes gene_type:complete